MITPAHTTQHRPVSSREPSTYPNRGAVGLSPGDTPTPYGAVPLEDPNLARRRPAWVLPAVFGAAILLGFAVPYLIRSVRHAR